MLLAASILNKIAQTTRMKHRWAKCLFLMNQDELTKQREAQEALLANRGYSAQVISAYLSIAPLLAENVAISRYIERTGNLQLRQALPEVVSVEEALTLANLDYELSLSELSQLRGLLSPLADSQSPDDGSSSQPTLRYEIPEERLEMGGAPPKLGTYTPPPMYRVRKR